MLLLELPFFQRDDNNSVCSFPTSAFVDTIKLEGILNWYRINHYGETAYNKSIGETKATLLLLLNTLYQVVDNDNNEVDNAKYSKCKHNGCQVLLF